MSSNRRSGSEIDALRSAPVLVATPAEVEAERAELLPWLEQQIAGVPLERARSRAERRRKLIALGGGVAVAAAAGFAIWITGVGSWDAEQLPARAQAAFEGPAATLLDGRLESGSLEVLPGSKLGQDSRFRTSAVSGARLLTSGGATLSAFPGTEFALSPRSLNTGDALIELSRGAIGFSVPKLEDGHAFRVKTADALVTVVGTRFFVDASGTTCVRVEEGSVRVKRSHEERLLRPGDAWGCEAPADAAEASDEQARQATNSDRGGARQARTEGQLDQQNRLLATALAAERKGDLGRARAAFDELLRRHPDSPFGPEARAGLARLKGR